MGYRGVMVRGALQAWSRRQWVVVVALAPTLGTAFVKMAGVPLGGLPVAWFALMGLAAILSAGVLGSYVPQEGFRPDLGCAPCAVMPVATVVGAMIAVNTFGPAVIGPALAAAVTLFGLTERLSDVNSCDVPVDPRAGEPVQVAVRTREHPDE